MTTPVDYPAAHSMDTQWFAVDKDGHVAHFESGEAGAVPEDAYVGEEWGKFVELIGKLPASELLFDSRGRFAPESNAPAHMAYPGMDALVFLASLDSMREALAAGKAKEVKATQGVAVILEKPDEGALKALHDSGACLGCSSHWEHREEEDGPAAHGVFAYSHLSENIYAGPYGRAFVPARPVKLEELPPKLREQVGKLRFEHVCFAETPHLQPAEHATCIGWDGAWFDGKTNTIRPLTGEGMDEVYEQNYGPNGDLRADMESEGITIAPADSVPKKPKRSFWSKLFGK